VVFVEVPQCILPILEFDPAPRGAEQAAVVPFLVGTMGMWHDFQKQHILLFPLARLPLSQRHICLQREGVDFPIEEDFTAKVFDGCEVCILLLQAFLNFVEVLLEHHSWQATLGAVSARLRSRQRWVRGACRRRVTRGIRYPSRQNVEHIRVCVSTSGLRFGVRRPLVPAWIENVATRFRSSQ